jgi:hypothetical protein
MKRRGSTRSCTARLHISRLSCRPVSVIAAIVASGCAPFVTPPGPAMPDRPGYTDTPPALPRNAIQLEAGITDDRAGAVGYRTLGEILLRAGVGGRTEARAFLNSFATLSVNGMQSASGMEDSKVGFKTNLRMKPDSVHSLLPNLSVLAGVTLPTGATAFRNAHSQPEAKLAMNWTTPSPFSVYSNVAGAGAYDGTRWRERGWASVALWYSVNPRISVFGEGISTRSLHAGAPPSNDVDAGITYLINDRFQLDARVGHGIGRVSGSERFIGAGFARRW